MNFSQASVNLELEKNNTTDDKQGTKIFKYCTHPANTCSCPLKVYAIKNISE